MTKCLARIRALRKRVKGIEGGLLELNRVVGEELAVVEDHEERLDGHERRISWLENRVEKRGRPPKKR